MNKSLVKAENEKITILTKCPPLSRDGMLTPVPERASSLKQQIHEKWAS
jgi:hypothetical protein